jgi:hypothetical protein
MCPCVSYNFGPVLKHMTHPPSVARPEPPVDRFREDLGALAALQLRLHWFETEVLCPDENLKGLSRINQELPAKVEAMDPRQRWCWIWTEATRSLLYWRQLPHMGAKACRNVNHHMFME